MEIAARLKVTMFNWRTLLRLAAIGNLIVLLTMFIALNDTLALALAAIILVGLGLLRFRGGMAGVVILGLVSTDIALYTVTGAVSNVIHGEGLLDIVIPSLLGSSSLAGLIAAIAVGLRRKNPQAGEQAARVVAGGAAALFVMFFAASAFFRPAGQEVALPGDLLLAVCRRDKYFYNMNSPTGQNEQLIATKQA